MTHRLVALSICSAAAFAGCATSSSDSDPGNGPTGLSGLRSIEQDLGPGSEGGDVAAVQGYLTDFGYFPNAALARDYPSWKPLVATPPHAGIFDGQTAQAVRAFQRIHGLPQTGIVDAPTLGLMQGARCGVPDGLEDGGGDHDKFAHVGTPWSNRNLKWQLSGSVPSSLMTQSVKDAIASALLLWSLETGLTFTEATGSDAADIRLSFGTLASTNALASTFPPLNGDVTFSNTVSWSVAATTPSGSFDLLSVALHELGHSLGLHHSSIEFPAGTRPVMWFDIASGTQRRALTADDKVSISALYDVWGNHQQLVQPLPGSAHDIAVSANNDVWAIGTIANQAGFRIYKWQSGAWNEASGNGGALRIAVAPDGSAWACDANGNVWTHAANHTSGGWIQNTGACAVDLAVGANGAVWGVGCPTNPGGHKIYRWNWNGSNTWTVDSANGGALRIAVDHQGRPWAVNDAGQVFKRSSDNPTTGSWSEVTGVGATDISVSPAGYAWIISDQATGGGFKIFVRDDQPAGGGDTPARAQWIQVPGGGVSISAGPVAVWATNNSQQIWKQIEKSLF